MRIVFMGTPAAAVPSLRRIVLDGHELVAVYTQPDRPAGRGNRITASPVKQAASVHGAIVLQPTKIKTDEAIQTFRGHAADVLVVVAYGRILPEKYLSAFRHGAVNVHFSLLPKYRGAAPVNWAIANGERYTGVTTMKMDAGLDTGPILLQSQTEIGDNENAVALMTRLAELGADTLSATLRDLGELTVHEQPVDGVSYAAILKKEDGLIDWSCDAALIANRIRGFQPFPTAFTYRNDKRVTIWAAKSAGQAATTYAPGTFAEVSAESLKLSCGSGSVLEISELQTEGRRRMSARDFVNGVRPRVGERLGDRTA